MADRPTTTDEPHAPYVDVLLRELERLIIDARPILMTDQVRLDGKDARSLIESIRDALAEERSAATR